RLAAFATSGRYTHGGPPPSVPPSAGGAVQAWKSASDILSRFFTNAVSVQISSSFTPALLKDGIAVIRMPFLMIQKICAGSLGGPTSLRSGTAGSKPSENLAHCTPGAPWQFAQPLAAKARAPDWMTLLSSIETGGVMPSACLATEACRTDTRLEDTMSGSVTLAATL